MTKIVTIHGLVRDASFRSLGMYPDNMQLGFNDALYLLCRVSSKQSPSRDHMIEKWTDREVCVRHVISLYERYLQITEKLVVQISVEFPEILSWLMVSPCPF